MSDYSVPEGVLYSVDISWHGQTIGDRIVIYANNAKSGTKILDFVLPTAAGSFPFPLPSVGKRFEKGLFVNPQLSDETAGKFQINIGWDTR